ncbi:endo-1,4-beta-xylanase 4-like [Lycium barbarum]|uniref:endo-1,4-beta-xylanase 4-like n=1 Tax=Lycium barbarum TaxID=112863 RepID=UPI00293F5F68|nr:endo-1,4-beta-xylanase 4-like [Lycium barbarum]
MLVRGHCIVWENRDQLPTWLRTLPPPLLSAAIERIFSSIIPRFQGQVMHWDVDNENMHFNFLVSQLGVNTSAYFYRKAHDMDGYAVMFLNEFGTIETPDDNVANPAKYLAKIKEIQSMGYDGPLGMGLQGHFGTPNIPYMRSALDMLKTADIL